jgi:hypothetical protein
MSMSINVPAPEHARNARWLDPVEGEMITGQVIALPARGVYAGTRLFLRTDTGETIAIAAAARRGWTVIERSLTDQQIRVGDRIAVTFLGWRRTADGEQQYRNVRLQILERAA